MAEFTQEELSEAHRALLSTLNKCEKIDLEKQAKSQQTLLIRRMDALRVALVLIEKELARIESKVDDCRTEHADNKENVSTLGRQGS